MKVPMSEETSVLTFKARESEFINLMPSSWSRKERRITAFAPKKDFKL